MNLSDGNLESGLPRDRGIHGDCHAGDWVGGESWTSLISPEVHLETGGPFLRLIRFDGLGLLALVIPCLPTEAYP